MTFKLWQSWGRNGFWLISYDDMGELLENRGGEACFPVGRTVKPYPVAA